MNDRFLRALRREPVDRTPVWFMRQAGRYLPEYRELRGDRDILEAIREPELAVEITLQPLRRMPLDAAIVFSDIVVPLAAIGVDVRIEPGVGPVVAEPIRDAAGVRRLRPLEPEADEPYVLETIRLLRKELDVPLIGFAGAPFTLASYLVEGGPSRDHAQDEGADARRAPDLGRADGRARADLARAPARAGRGRRAGRAAVRLVGRGARPRRLPAVGAPVGPPRSSRTCRVPSIHFGVGTGRAARRSCAEAGGDAIGVDWRVPLDRAWERIGHDRAIQGNLDPAVCIALRGRSSSARRSPCSSAPRCGTGTCSTSATGCCRRRRSSTSSASSTSCTSGPSARRHDRARRSACS